MILLVKAKVLVFLPEEIDYIEGFFPYTSTTFGTILYHVYFGSILTSPERQQVLSGTTMGDVEFGLSKGNFGCRILIEGTDNEFVVTWREVLCGGKTGI